MGERLTRLLDHAATHTAFTSPPVPVLVWEAAPRERTSSDLLWVTNPKIRVDRPSNDPLLYRVEKASRQNAFGLGITLGRATNNDVVVDDPSVSRFHAYLQLDGHSKVWHVVDAESSTGTFVGGERLAPRRPAPLADGAVFTVGHVELKFLSPESFGGFLKAWPKLPGSPG
ncbi:MAG TPA: FHA domain-containing protein [Myxococcales bacterium]|jgi:pSer/pThr/pTyr-binding forkhead associated (FHA) protein|nr:FHA domain-containing protein [Myxococcales bacterium]